MLWRGVTLLSSGLRMLLEGMVIVIGVAAAMTVGGTPTVVAATGVLDPTMPPREIGMHPAVDIVVVAAEVVIAVRAMAAAAVDSPVVMLAPAASTGTPFLVAALQPVDTMDCVHQHITNVARQRADESEMIARRRTATLLLMDTVADGRHPMLTGRALRTGSGYAPRLRRKTTVYGVGLSRGVKQTSQAARATVV